MSYKHIVFLIGIILIVFGLYSNQAAVDGVPDSPVPVDPVVIPAPEPPKPNIPDLINHILYDDYKKAEELSIVYKRKLVLIFGASWCPYCKTLKEEALNIKELTKYIVCFIDTDSNETLVEKYKIKNLPTSIIVQSSKELARKIGYKQKEYKEWLLNMDN